MKIFVSLFALMLCASVASAGVKAPPKTKVPGDPRAAIRNLGKLKRYDIKKHMNTKPARKPIEKVTK